MRGRLLVLLFSAVVGDKEVESNVTGWDTDSVCRALTAALWLEMKKMDEKRGKTLLFKSLNDRRLNLPS
jgi:hypothetical protein